MNNKIELTQTKAEVTDISMDVDFAIQDGELDLAEALQMLLGKAKDKMTLKAGKYNVRLLAVITREEE